jgi:hypothetical protein
LENKNSGFDSSYIFDAIKSRPKPLRELIICDSAIWPQDDYDLI